MASRLDTTNNKSAIREVSVQHSKLCLLLFKQNIMKIEKTIKGEKYRYYCRPLLNQMKVEVKWFMCDEPVICDISEDFNYIIPPETFLTPYITNYGRIPVGKIKVNRLNKIELKEFNENK